MAKVVVWVETDHLDPEEAVRSVSNSMERAGYDVIESKVDGRHAIHPLDVRVAVQDLMLRERGTLGLVRAQEPEVNSGRSDRL